MTDSSAKLLEDLSGPGEEGDPYYHKAFMIIVTLGTLVQAALTTSIHGLFTNLSDLSGNNVVSISNGWLITLWILFVVSLIATILIFFMEQRGQLVVLIFMIILFIINISLLGFAFYFQSQAVGSADYVQNTSNAIQLKDTIIGLLVVTGIIIILIAIYFLVFYLKFKGKAVGRGFGSVFSGLASGSEIPDITGKNWFQNDDNRFNGKTCNKWWNEFQKHFLEYLQYKKLTESNSKLDLNTKNAILDQVVQSLIRSSSATQNPVASTE